MLPPSTNGMVELTPNYFVPARRAREWFIGMRPLPDMDDEACRFYFMSQVHPGGLTEREAFELLERHRQLTAMENRQEAPLPAEMQAELIRRGWTPPSGEA